MVQYTNNMVDRMKRFKRLVSNPDLFIDDVTGEVYHLSMDNVLELLNKESERADKNAELCTDEGLLKLEWQRGIYENFSKETLKILDKYEINSLKKLDRILFEQRVW